MKEKNELEKYTEIKMNKIKNLNDKKEKLKEISKNCRSSFSD